MPNTRQLMTKVPAVTAYFWIIKVLATTLGETGADLLDGGGGEDLLDGGADADVIYGGNGDDTVIGGAGDDDLFMGHGDDEAYGGDGADILYFWNGSDAAFGGAGADTFYVTDRGNSRQYVEGGEGADLVVINVADDTNSVVVLADFNPAAGDAIRVIDPDFSATQRGLTGTDLTTAITTWRDAVRGQTAFNSDLGWGQGLNGQSYPLMKNFYVGGLGSVRGYQQSTLGGARMPASQTNPNPVYTGGAKKVVAYFVNRKS